MYSVYVVATPRILTPRNEERKSYINKIVRRHVSRNASEICELNNGYTLIKVLRPKKMYRLTHVALRNLVKDIWANNLLRNTLGQ